MQMRSPTRFTVRELLLVIAIVAIIVTAAVPGVLRSRMLGNEAAAIASLRSIAGAEVAYASVCGGNRYAASLATLGVPAPGSQQAFLSSDLARPAPQQRGYRFTLQSGDGAVPGPPDCNGTATTTGYYGSASPLEFGRTGARSFAVNTAGVIWQSPSAAAPLEPFAAPSVPIQ